MELKPCPFCAGEAALSSRDDAVSNHSWFWVTCRICKGGQSQSLYSVGEAAETAWNDYCAGIVAKNPTGFA